MSCCFFELILVWLTLEPKILAVSLVVYWKFCAAADDDDGLSSFFKLVSFCVFFLLGPQKNRLCLQWAHKQNQSSMYICVCIHAYIMSSCCFDSSVVMENTFYSGYLSCSLVEEKLLNAAMTHVNRASISSCIKRVRRKIYRIQWSIPIWVHICNFHICSNFHITVRKPCILNVIFFFVLSLFEPPPTKLTI